MSRGNPTLHLSPSSARARGRRAGRAFTLIELTVALVAGLIVALAVASLSREATATFHEEVRISAAEAGLRAAADRLRADLARASFMSTPNIQVDPHIATVFGQPTNLPANAPASLRTFQGIRFNAGSTTKNGPSLALETTNNMNPASIDITGNMTSADQFEVQSVAIVGQCCQISLASSSPAIFRMMNADSTGKPDTANMDAEMQAIFAPAPPLAGQAVTRRQFWVRYVDLVTNHAQYLPTCSKAAGPVASLGAASNGGKVAPFVLIDASDVTPSATPCPLTGAQTGTVTASNGNTGGLATVNPVQTVRWEIVATPPPQDQLALDNLPLGGQDPAKFDLVRSFVDMSILGNGVVIPETTEVIAEYAVDLDFAFSVDNGDTTGTAPTVVSYDFGDPTNQLVADTVNVAAPVAGPLHPDPQRIRSVRFRLATRAAQPDRANDIPVPTPGNGLFHYRYCVPPNGGNACAGTTPLEWARVRTVVGEVALPNQQQAFF